MRRNDAPTPEQASNAAEIAAEAQRAIQAPFLWLSEVERLCVRAFVPDAAIMERCRARVVGRTVKGTPVVKDPPRVKGELPVLEMGMAIGWKALDRPLTDAEESEVATRIQRAITNRDLLAARIGRPETVRWRGHPSDAYNASPKVYRRRLATVGRALVVLGWMSEPPHIPGEPRVVVTQDMNARERDAEATAEAWVG